MFCFVLFCFCLFVFPVSENLKKIIIQNPNYIILSFFLIICINSENEFMWVSSNVCLFLFSLLLSFIVIYFFKCLHSKNNLRILFPITYISSHLIATKMRIIYNYSLKKGVCFVNFNLQNENKQNCTDWFQKKKKKICKYSCPFSLLLNVSRDADLNCPFSLLLNVSRDADLNCHNVLSFFWYIH